MKWFTSCKNEGEIKARFRDLAKQYHPDLGGDTATMQDINVEYEAALKSDYRAQGMDENKANWRWEMDKEVAAKAAEFLKVSRKLKVEICGLWIWITGETRAVKDQLKTAGCFWAAKKSAWYWRRASDACRKRRRGTLTLEQIRLRYGSHAMRAGEDEGKAENNLAFIQA